MQKEKKKREKNITSTQKPDAGSQLNFYFTLYFFIICTALRARIPCLDTA